MARLALFLFTLFLLLIVLRGLRIFLAAFLRPHGAGGGARRDGARVAEMVRDPVCGTWIDRGLALSGRSGGSTVAVCSEKCLRALEAAR